jgi:hypothetical protein
VQVCDERARKLNNDARSAVAENLHVVTVNASQTTLAAALAAMISHRSALANVQGNENTGQKVKLTTPLYPSLRKT